MPGLLRACFAFSLSATLLAMLLGTARGDDTRSYSAHAKTTIGEILKGRTFMPEAGCEDLAACTVLLTRLRDGDFSVVEPAESSDRADMPSYLRVRSTCPALDPMRITLTHRTYEATRGFAAYRLNLPSTNKRADEILIFRAEHYVSLDASLPLAPAETVEQTVLVSGTFIAIGLRGCRLLSSTRAEDGDWLAKHNTIGDDDYASELLKIGERYFVLNLAPIAGPRQPEASWWYALELWDLGPGADADRRKHRHIYSFSYKPGAAPIGVGHEAPPAAPG